MSVGQTSPKRIVDVEEHFLLPDLLGRIPKIAARERGHFSRDQPYAGFSRIAQLSDTGEERLRVLDEAGVSMQVVSLTVQAPIFCRPGKARQPIPRGTKNPGMNAPHAGQTQTVVGAVLLQELFVLRRTRGGGDVGPVPLRQRGCCEADGGRAAADQKALARLELERGEQRSPCGLHHFVIRRHKLTPPLPFKSDSCRAARRRDPTPIRTDALRWSIVAGQGFYVLAAALYFLASRSLVSDRVGDDAR